MESLHQRGLLLFVYHYLSYSSGFLGDLFYGLCYLNYSRCSARGAATGISALVLNIGTLIVSLFFPILSDALSTEWVFLIFAFIGVLAMIFVIKFLPETRGRSLEEIEYELRERTGARTE